MLTHNTVTSICKDIARVRDSINPLRKLTNETLSIHLNIIHLQLQLVNKNGWFDNVLLLLINIITLVKTNIADEVIKAHMYSLQGMLELDNYHQYHRRK